MKDKSDPKPANPEAVVAEDADFPPRGAQKGFVDMSGIVLNMLGHAHIDIGYRWDIQETIHRIAPWTFKGVLALMEQVPGFTFAQSQMFLYQAMERHYPEIFRQIKAWVAKGQWEVLGTSWCEYDVMLPCGEAVIRQHLTGLHYALEKLGATNHEVAFFPDSFCGHPATLPQILAGCGLKYYVFGRGLPQSKAGPDKTRRAFRWQGPDNSHLIAYLPFGPYSTPEITEPYLRNYLPYIQAAVSNQELVLYGKGDHGGGPRADDIAALEALKGIHKAPGWRFTTAHAFFAATFDEPGTATLETHQGSLFAMATGAYTSQAGLKRANRQMEKKLLTAEAATVIATMLSRKPAFPRVDFQRLWQDLLTLQFHDILPGTSAPSVVREARETYRRISQACDTFLNDSFIRVRSRLDTTDKQHALIVFNPCLETVRQVVSAECPPWLTPDTLRAGQLCTAQGSPVETEAIGDRIVFMLQLPPASLQLLRLVPHSNPPPRAPDMTFDGECLEAPLFKLTFDRKTGDIAQIVDKRRNLPLMAQPSYCLRVLQEHAVATSWVEVLTGEETPLELVAPPCLVEHNRFLARIETTSRSAYSQFTREVTLYRDIARIDFRIRVDWHEGNSFLKVGFSPRLAGPIVTAAIAHGRVCIADAAREFCMHDWVDLNDGQRGMALLNDGAYGCNYDQGELGISVLRTVRDMDPGMAQGAHELRLALVPYEGPLNPSLVRRETAGFLGGLMAGFESGHPGAIKSWGRINNSTPLDDDHRFLAVDQPNIEICAFKMPEEDWTPDTFVIRMRETDGRPTACVLTVPLEPAAVVAADHLERALDRMIPFEGTRIPLAFNASEIRTILVRLA
ncbi:MAG: glycoside hydrolase family 38 C-terminal domain-containing protein [Rhodospirillales bacterium]|jgi:alpha-mannosidase|nr:glycoside hydrolase family 38 C-terminal domain-containing protein [Rhodospirillales bacterium]